MGKDGQSLGDVLKNPWVKLSAAIIILIILCWFIYLLSNTVLAFTLAFVVAYLIEPAVTWFAAITHLNRSISVMIVTFVFLILLCGIGFLIYLDFSTVFEKPLQPEQQQQQQEALNKITDSNAIKEKIQQQGEKLPSQLQPIGYKILARIAANIESRLRDLMNYLDKLTISMIKSVTLVISDFFMFVVYVIVMVYLMRDMHIILDTAAKCIPEKYRADAVRLGRLYSIDLRGFFRGQIIVISTQFCIFLAGFYIFGIPYAIPIALFTALFNIIPYLGTITGSALGFAVCLMTYGVDIHLFLVVAVILGGQLIDIMLITPLLIGKNAQMNPVAVIMALIIFWELLGVYGVILAIPFAAAIKVLVREAIYKMNVKSEVEKAAESILPPKTENT